MLGYTRYWFAEHHESPVFTAPELMITFVASMTDHLRVGAAGVLLTLYSPFKVAESFRLLSTLFPHRIDLGVARGTTSEPAMAKLMDGRPYPESAERFYARAGELFAHAAGAAEPRAAPASAPVPELWVMAGGEGGASSAARIGASVSLSLFHSAAPAGPEALRRYRDEFEPQPWSAAPSCTVAVAGVCAATSKEAEEIARSNENPFVHPTVVGDARACADALRATSYRYGVDEVVFKDVCGSPAERIRCYELLADAVGLRAS